MACAGHVVGLSLSSSMHIYLCPSPELYPLYHRPQTTVIIVDIFRASTTMVTAFAHGAKAIYPVASTQEAESEGKRRHCLIAAERNIVRCPFAHLGNDPAEYMADKVQDQEIVFTTTNGTRALTIAREQGADTILVGALTNLRATLRHCASLGQDVVVLAAGWKGQASMEDMLYAGALADEAERLGLGSSAGDMAMMAHDLWKSHCLTLEERLQYIQKSEHYLRLEKAGFASAVPYCLTIDSFDLVLQLDGDHLISHRH